MNQKLPKEYVWVTSFEAVAPAKGAGFGGNVAEAGAEAGPGTGRIPETGGLRASREGQVKRAEVASEPRRGAVILLLKGLYLWNPRQALVVDDFVAKLKESEMYEVDEKNLKRSVPNDQEWAYGYEIPLILKNPIKLSPAELAASDK